MTLHREASNCAVEADLVGSGSETRTAIRHIDYEEARRVGALASDYTTDRAFRLERQGNGGELRWALREEALEQPFSSSYDSGNVDEMLDAYGDSVTRDKLQFILATRAGRAVGLLTWQPVTWNSTLWLLDIRSGMPFRREGVGSMLLQSIQSLAAERKCRGITVETQIANYPAVRLYLKHGFQVAGFHDHFYTNTDLERQDVALFLFWCVPGKL
ncbi:MAG: GNAT family N-acetyltransferase [Chloroflexota bacterium]